MSLFLTEVVDEKPRVLIVADKTDISSRCYQDLKSSIEDQDVSVETVDGQSLIFPQQDYLAILYFVDYIPHLNSDKDVNLLFKKVQKFEKQNQSHKKIIISHYLSKVKFSQNLNKELLTKNNYHFKLLEKIINHINVKKIIGHNIIYDANYTNLNLILQLMLEPFFDNEIRYFNQDFHFLLESEFTKFISQSIFNPNLENEVVVQGQRRNSREYAQKLKSFLEKKKTEFPLLLNQNQPLSLITGNASFKKLRFLDFSVKEINQSLSKINQQWFNSALKYIKQTAVIKENEKLEQLRQQKKLEQAQEIKTQSQVEQRKPSVNQELSSNERFKAQVKANQQQQKKKNKVNKDFEVKVKTLDSLLGFNQEQAKSTTQTNQKLEDAELKTESEVDFQEVSLDVEKATQESHKDKPPKKEHRQQRHLQPNNEEEEKAAVTRQRRVENNKTQVSIQSEQTDQEVKKAYSSTKTQSLSHEKSKLEGDNFVKSSLASIVKNRVGEVDEWQDLEQQETTTLSANEVDLDEALDQKVGKIFQKEVDKKTKEITRKKQIKNYQKKKQKSLLQNLMIAGLFLIIIVGGLIGVLQVSESMIQNQLKSNQGLLVKSDFHHGKEVGQTQDYWTKIENSQFWYHLSDFRARYLPFLVGNSDSEEIKLRNDFAFKLSQVVEAEKKLTSLWQQVVAGILNQELENKSDAQENGENKLLANEFLDYRKGMSEYFQLYADLILAYKKLPSDQARTIVDDSDFLYQKFEEIQHQQEMLTVMPDLIGLNLNSKKAAAPKDKKIAVLIQNHSVPRGKNGLIDLLLVLDFNQGRLVQSQLLTASEVEEKLAGTFEASDEIQAYLKSKEWKFQDLAWSDDFSKVSSKVREYLNLAIGENVDQVVALNYEILNQILDDNLDYSLVTQINQLYQSKREQIFTLNQKNNKSEKISQVKQTEEVADENQDQLVNVASVSIGPVPEEQSFDMYLGQYQASVKELIKSLVGDKIIGKTLLNTKVVNEFHNLVSYNKILISDTDTQINQKVKELLRPSFDEEGQKACDPEDVALVYQQTGLNSDLTSQQKQCLSEVVKYYVKNTSNLITESDLKREVKHAVFLEEDGQVQHKQTITIKNTFAKDLIYTELLSIYLADFNTIDELRINNKELKGIDKYIKNDKKWKIVQLPIGIRPDSKITIEISYFKREQFQVGDYFLYFNEYDFGSGLKIADYDLNFIFDRNVEPLVIAPDAKIDNNVVNFGLWDVFHRKITVLFKNKKSTMLKID